MNPTPTFTKFKNSAVCYVVMQEDTTYSVGVRQDYPDQLISVDERTYEWWLNEELQKRFAFGQFVLHGPYQTLIGVLDRNNADQIAALLSVIRTWGYNNAVKDMKAMADAHPDVPLVPSLFQRT